MLVVFLEIELRFFRYLAMMVMIRHLRFFALFVSYSLCFFGLFCFCFYSCFDRFVILNLLCFFCFFFSSPCVCACWFLYLPEGTMMVNVLCGQIFKSKILCSFYIFCNLILSVVGWSCMTINMTYNFNYANLYCVPNRYTINWIYCRVTFDLDWLWVDVMASSTFCRPGLESI